jgi:putative transposase
LIATLLAEIPRGRHGALHLPVTPATILRRRRDLVKRGYRRITGEPAGLGITVAPSTVWEILRKHGIAPVPRRSSTRAIC